MFETAAMLRALGGSVENAPWGWGILVVLVLTLIKMRPLMRQLAQTREGSLLKARADDNHELRGRVEALEARLDVERARHEAERSIDRHRINNLTQCLDALLMLLEVAPDKSAEHVAKIKAMRDRQSAFEAAESATIRAATITATKQEGLP